MACEQVTLQDVCELIVDCPHTSAKDEGVGYPLIRTPNVGRGRLILTGVHRVSQDVYERRVSRAVPRQGDLILAREAPAGNVAIVSPGIEVCLGQRTMLLRPDSSFVVPEYLNYYLNAPEQRDRMLRLANGATVSHINVADIRNMPVQLPSRGEQSKVAELLNVLDDKIDLNNRLNDYLLDLLKSSAKNLYLKHEKNIQEKLPSGWRWVSIGEIADMVCRGIAPKYSLESDEIILGQTCIRNNLILTENGRSHAPKKLTDKWLRKYDLLINSTGVGSLGRTAQVWFEPSKLVVDSHVTIVRATDKKNALYLGSWAFEHERYIESLHTGSTGQTELPRDRVKAIRVVLPDAGTLDEFNAIAEPSVKMIVANQEENKRLIEIRDTLLPKLMSGEIDVSKVDLMQLTNNHLPVRGHNVPNCYWKGHLWKPSLIMFCHKCRTCSIRHSSNIWPKYSESHCSQLRKHQRRRTC